MGHIPGARSASLATLLDDVADLPLNTPIAVAGYTGQTAGAALDGDPATAVMDRLQAVLSHGFRSIGYSEIEANPDDYFIINYFAHDDYMGQGNSGVPGHIPGAFQFTPYASLALDQMLDNIPADMPVVVYCWAGQHSARLVTYLNMLGYDAYSLRYGVNALFHSNLTAHRWTGNSLEFPWKQCSTPPSPRPPCRCSATPTRSTRGCR